MPEIRLCAEPCSYRASYSPTSLIGPPLYNLFCPNLARSYQDRRAKPGGRSLHPFLLHVAFWLKPWDSGQIIFPATLIVNILVEFSSLGLQNTHISLPICPSCPGSSHAFSRPASTLILTSVPRSAVRLSLYRGSSLPNISYTPFWMPSGSPCESRWPYRVYFFM